MTAEQSSSPRGWDNLYQNAKDDLKNNADVLVCFTHYVLTCKGFGCIGIGDDKVLDGNEKKGEKLLPLGWNTEYALRYIYEGKLYLLCGTLVDDTVQINLVRVDERRVSLIALNVRMVLKKRGRIEEMMPNYPDIRGCIEKQLIEPVVTSSKNSHQGTQTIVVKEDSNESSRESLLVRTPELLYHGREREPEPVLPFSPLLEPHPAGIGRSDLDPFFGGARPFGPGSIGGRNGGGGMLYPSPRGETRGGGGGLTGPDGQSPLGTGVPPHAVPPGSRFDPLSPVNPDENQRTSRNPGSDDFPPPDFGNMFM